MQKFLPFIIFLLLFFSPVPAQYRNEAALGLGGVALFGDIGTMGKGMMVHGSWGFFPNEDFQVVAGMNMSWAGESDAGSLNASRDYAYSTLLVEIPVQLRFYYWKWSGPGYSRRGLVLKNALLMAYLSAGFSPLYFRPQPKQALAENYDDNFSRFAVSVPIGAGIRYALNRDWSLGLDLAIRMPGTDYLDGYTSGYSQANDLYYGGTIQLVYRIPTKAERRRR